MTQSTPLPSSISEPMVMPKLESIPTPVPKLTNSTQSLTFTGSGHEYFRIWIVNLCLTLATLGIYSAWAKVRRLQYFDRNTQLGGASFNFHGNPVTILKGRMLALVLLVAYHYAFGFSKIFGITVITVLFFTLPWLLRSALRFRLRNTSYRGLRFNFSGNLLGAYLCFMPLLALIFLPAISAALIPGNPKILLTEIGVLYLAWPAIHAAIKRYQQAHIGYGNHESSYHASIFSLIKPYVLAFLMGIGLVIVLGILFAIAMAATNKASDSSWKWALPVMVGFVYIYGIYLIAGPYLQTRIWNIVWNKTDFPGFTIHSDLKFLPYLKLQTINLILTLITLGLYRPFAVVRTYQYRLSNMSVLGSGFEYIQQSEQNKAITAGGDSSADLFGIDLSF